MEVFRKPTAPAARKNPATIQHRRSAEGALPVSSPSTSFGSATPSIG